MIICLFASALLLLSGMIGTAGVKASCVDMNAMVPDEGLRYEMAEKWQDAIDLYRSILQNSPERVDLRLRIANIEAHLGDKPAAALSLMEAAEFCADDPGLFARASHAFSAASLPNQALEAIKRALEIEPENTEYLLSHAELASWNAKYPEAAKSYEKVLKHDPANKSAMIGIARLWSWRGNADKAAKAYRNYLKNYPDDPDAILDAARNELWRGNSTAAMRLLDGYRNKFGETAAYLKLAARVLASANRPSVALGLLSRLPQDEARDYDALYAEVLALYYGHRLSEAFDLLDKLSKMEGHDKETNDLKCLLLYPYLSNIQAGARFYAESDSLKIETVSVLGAYFLSPLTRVCGGERTDFLWADRNSGLERIDGGRSSWHIYDSIGVSHLFSPQIAVDMEAGSALVPGDDIFAYRVASHWFPLDELKIDFQRQVDFFPISPRTLSEDIRIGENVARFNWTPNLQDTVDAFFSFDTLSDNNSRWQAAVAPRTSVWRTQALNLDLGLSAWLLSYDKSLQDGYYDPKLYQRYLATSFWYWKISDRDGLGVILGLGAQKDEQMRDFEFGGSVDAEGTFTLSREWLLKINAGAFHNVRTIAGGFDAFQTGVTVTRRF